MFTEDRSMVCPATHRPPAESRETHCPAWCAGQHEPLIWPACCDLVVHLSQPLAASSDGRTLVMLAACEDVAGTEPASLEVFTPSEMTLSFDQADDLADMIRDAARVGRAVLEGSK